MHLLHVDSSILGDASVSRQLTAAIVAEQHQAYAGLTVDRLDLAAAPIGHLTAADLGGGDASALERFLAADIVVVGAPMYNFTIPSQLKAWIDRILIAGRTFEYTEQGPRGLVGGKKLIVGISRGGLYGADSPFAAAEHAQRLLAVAFGFIGITDLRFVIAEGLRAGLRDPTVIIDEALAEAQRIAA